MRYTNEQEARARQLGKKILEHGDKRYVGFEVAGEQTLRGSDYRAHIRLFSSKSRELDTDHWVTLYRGECIYVCDCQAQDFDRPCKHVGMALEQHDLDIELAADARQGGELSSCEACGAVVPESELTLDLDDENIAISVCRKCRGEDEGQAREERETVSALEPVLYRNPQPFSIFKCER